MGEKADAAMDAVGHAPAELRTVPQHRGKCVLILPDERVSAFPEMPVFIKREEFRDRDDKKARDSVTILNSVTPSCYLIPAKASRSNTRFFHAHAAKDTTGISTAQTTQASYATCENDHPTTRKKRSYLEEEPFLFQVVGQLSKQTTGQFAERHRGRE